MDKRGEVCQCKASFLFGENETTTCFVVYKRDKGVKITSYGGKSMESGILSEEGLQLVELLMKEQSVSHWPDCFRSKSI